MTYLNDPYTAGAPPGMPAGAPWHKANCGDHLDGQEENRRQSAFRQRELPTVMVDGLDISPIVAEVVTSMVCRLDLVVHALQVGVAGPQRRPHENAVQVVADCHNATCFQSPPSWNTILETHGPRTMSQPLALETIMKILNTRSLAATVDAVDEALFHGRSISRPERLEAAKWIARRQGEAGSYARLGFPTNGGPADGIICGPPRTLRG